MAPITYYNDLKSLPDKSGINLACVVVEAFDSSPAKQRLFKALDPNNTEFEVIYILSSNTHTSTHSH